MEWLPWRKRNRDLERELKSDLELEAEELVERGLSKDEAYYAARRAFGNSTLVAESVRAAWGWTWFESLQQDLRFGFRVLLKSPGITLSVVLSLALGLGATTAFFSMLNALLFKALPVAQPDRLVVLQHGVGSSLSRSFSYPQFAQLRQQAKGSLDLFGVGWGSSLLQSNGVDRKVESELVSGDYFRVLGVRPFLGRLLSPSDDVPGAASALSVVISYRLWENDFRGDPGIVGRKVTLSSAPFTIVGVAQRGFFGASVGSHADIMLPFASEPVVAPEIKLIECRACYWMDIMGRLAPDVTPTRAHAALSVMWKDVRRATIPDSMTDRNKAAYFADRIAIDNAARGVSSLRDRFTQPLSVLLAMAAVILLISCSNIANLLTARAIARRRELAVRLSIGAQRRRLVRQLMTESGLLAIAGFVASVAVYRVCVTSLLGFMRTGGDDYYLDTAPDLRMVVFAAGLTGLTLILFGLAPALRATRWGSSDTLAESARSVTTRPGFARTALCGQLALSFALLLGAILLARSLYDLRTFNAGFRRDHLLLINPYFGRQIPKERDQFRHAEAFLSAIRNMAGVRSASASAIVPLHGATWDADFTTPGFSPRKESDYRCAVNVITSDFFRTMGTRFLAGRDFNASDDEVGPKTAIVNQSFARRYWGSTNPTGKQIRQLDGKETIAVVGLVEDTKHSGFRDDLEPAVYLPIRQSPKNLWGISFWGISLEVWTSDDPHLLAGPARDLLNREMKDVPVRFQTFTEMIEERLLYERLMTALAVAFGGLGILICAVGIYGVAAYSVNRRTAEIGIRMALGATPGAMMRFILREQMIIAAIGLAAGAMGALWLMPTLRTWLFGVSPSDPPSVIASVLFLAAVTALATSVPAFRAARVEPLRALRHE